MYFRLLILLRLCNARSVLNLTLILRHMASKKIKILKSYTSMVEYAIVTHSIVIIILLHERVT